MLLLNLLIQNSKSGHIFRHMMSFKWHKNTKTYHVYYQHKINTRKRNRMLRLQWVWSNTRTKNINAHDTRTRICYQFMVPNLLPCAMGIKIGSKKTGFFGSLKNDKNLKSLHYRFFLVFSGTLQYAKNHYKFIYFLDVYQHVFTSLMTSDQRQENKRFWSEVQIVVGANFSCCRPICMQCSQTACKNPLWRRWWCSSHYRQLLQIEVLSF